MYEDDDLLDEMQKQLENYDGGENIPEKFHSVYHDGPFTHCIACEKNFMESSSLYEIQKVFKGKRVIFEYALCVECGKGLMEEYSQESITALHEHFMANFLPSDEFQCNLCEKEEPQEHIAHALCNKGKMIMSFLMCEQCMESMESLISEKTRKTMDDFVKENFPGIPAEFTPVPLMKV